MLFVVEGVVWSSLSAAEVSHELRPREELLACPGTMSWSLCLSHGCWYAALSSEPSHWPAGQLSKQEH